MFSWFSCCLAGLVVVTGCSAGLVGLACSVGLAGSVTLAGLVGLGRLAGVSGCLADLVAVWLV